VSFFLPARRKDGVVERRRMASGARTEQGRAAAYSTLLYEQGATVLGAVTNRAVMMVSPYFVGRPRFSLMDSRTKALPACMGMAGSPPKRALRRCVRSEKLPRTPGWYASTCAMIWVAKWFKDRCMHPLFDSKTLIRCVLSGPCCLLMIGEHYCSRWGDRTVFVCEGEMTALNR
jgi:hypothetical protein